MRNALVRAGARRLGGGTFADGVLLAALLEAGLLARQVAQVIQLLAPHVRPANDFQLVHTRRMQQEGALDTDAVRADAADGVRLVDAPAPAAEHDTLEDLD